MAQEQDNQTQAQTLTDNQRKQAELLHSLQASRPEEMQLLQSVEDELLENIQLRVKGIKPDFANGGLDKYTFDHAYFKGKQDALIELEARKRTLISRYKKFREDSDKKPDA